LDYCFFASLVADWFVYNVVYPVLLFFQEAKVTKVFDGIEYQTVYRLEKHYAKKLTQEDMTDLKLNQVGYPRKRKSGDWLVDGQFVFSNKEFKKRYVVHE
jgi:hypothetical protein